MLNDWSGVNKDKASEYIRNSVVSKYMISHHYLTLTINRILSRNILKGGRLGGREATHASMNHSKVGGGGGFLGASPPERKRISPPPHPPLIKP